MKNISLLAILMALFSNGLAASQEWTRKDLYKEGKKSVDGGDCFLAIGQVYAFKEFNKPLLEEHGDTKNAIDSAIAKCRTKIISERKVEYVFLPTEKKCKFGQASSGGSGSVSALGNGISDIPKVKYRIVKKKGNPRGMEVPEYDIMFDIETTRSKLTYPLVPSIYYDGKFKPYGTAIPDLKGNPIADAEIKYGSELLIKYIQSSDPETESYMLDPSTLNEKIRVLEGSKIEVMPSIVPELK